MELEEDPPTPAPGRKRRVRLFQFPEAARLEDVPYIDDGPEVSDAAIDDFLGSHPDFEAEEDAEEQLWELVVDLLDGDASAVGVSRGPQGDWALTSRRPSGYSVLLSPDGAVVIAYATLHTVKTYEQVKRQKEVRRNWEMKRQAERERSRLAHEEAQERARQKREENRKKHEDDRQRVREKAVGKRSRMPGVEVRAVQDRARARNFVRAVMQGQISEEEGRKRAARKGCGPEFDAELRRERGGLGGG